MKGGYSIAPLLSFIGLARALSPPLWTISDLRDQVRPALENVEFSEVPPLGELYAAYNISVPIDHFHNDSRYEPHVDGTFPLRYWFDARFYRDGGPIILIQGGETKGDDRLAFLQKGIGALLAEATNGISVVLEHRYYGMSFPVANLSTESLRFLTTDQALADTAYFASHVKFPGLDHLDLTAPGTAYIAYGGSYAGAFVAFLRKVYPQIFWGAVSSSGVTAAIVDYWEYYEAIRLFAPAKCVAAIQKLVDVVDNILLGSSADTKIALKNMFGLVNLTHDTDFVTVLSDSLGGLQETNWDPDVSVESFNDYCGNISSSSVLYPWTGNITSIAKELVKAGGYEDEAETLTTTMLNFVGFHNATILSKCDKTVDECFTRYNDTFYALHDITQQWRSWAYQVCTQWGYFATGSGVPQTESPLISRLVDMEYATLICKRAFNITEPPDVDAINKHGSFNISYPRLAIIDGEADPWRAATPHRIGLPERKSTISEPFLLIKDGVHHWDENGIFRNDTRRHLPPAPVRNAQNEEVKFVKKWMEEWRTAMPSNQVQIKSMSSKSSKSSQIRVSSKSNFKPKKS